MRIMTDYNIGPVVLVKFPFTTLETEKKRPALVLRTVKHSTKIQNVIIAMITSKLDGIKLEGDVKLNDWQEAQLLHPSLVRLSKIATVDDQLIDKILGHLSKKDFQQLTKTFRKLFDDWF